MNGRRYGFTAVMASLLLLMFVPFASAGTAPESLVVNPQVVGIWSFFSGTRIHVHDQIPAGCQAVLIVRGKRIDEEMMRKSRHWDLWMNSGEVDIDEAPLLYFAVSSDPDLLTSPGADAPYGYAAIEKRVKFTGRIKPVEDDTIFQEFIQLKERDKLYHLYPGGLDLQETGHQTLTAEADLSLPSRIKPGLYHVTLLVLKDGKQLEEHTGTFEVKLQGLPALLQTMAKQHGLLYGILAVVVAVSVGMFTGVIFRRKGKGH